MQPLPRSTAKDVFSYLLAIVTLYVGVISFITLYFQYINVKFPDVLNFYYPAALEIIRVSMASLIVVWPVFILISWMIYRDLKNQPTKIDIAIRKWLLYLTLFITSITIIVDLITLVNYFLNGEITIRFILKVLVVLVVAAAVFAYYLWDLRRDTAGKTKLPRNVGIVTILIALGTIILGFVFVGSPASQRLVRMDSQRVEDLAEIQYEMINYYSLKQELPETLSDLNNSISGFVAPTDPEDQSEYQYQIISDLEFELCATFATESTDSSVQSRAMYYGERSTENWSHQIGYTCFTRTIDPELYPKPVVGEALDF